MKACGRVERAVKTRLLVVVHPTSTDATYSMDATTRNSLRSELSPNRPAASQALPHPLQSLLSVV